MTEFNQSIAEIAEADDGTFEAALAAIKAEYAAAWVRQEPERFEDFKEDMRQAVLAAMDEVCETHKKEKPKDQDLPRLFPSIDAFCDAVRR